MNDSVVGPHLAAFVALCEHGSFTAAARAIALSQPALSKRIALLEERVGERLFLRSKTHTALTRAGQLLLIFARETRASEAAFRARLQGGRAEALFGEVRIATFSTALRSRLLPRLCAWGRRHPGVHVHCRVEQTHALIPLLTAGEADLLVSLDDPGLAALDTVEVGHEDSVLVRSRRFTPPKGVFLDHDVHDTTTARYVQAHNAKHPPLAVVDRRFFNDVYALLDATAYGLGFAVAPRHLVAKDARLVVVRGSAVLSERIYCSRQRPLASSTARDPVAVLFGAIGAWFTLRRGSSPG